MAFGPAPLNDEEQSSEFRKGRITHERSCVSKSHMMA